jgi:hypothetical protein
MIKLNEYLFLFGVFLFAVYKLVYNRTFLPRYEMINKLIRQGARWYKGYQNDQNPLIGVLHANYAAGYLWALKDLFEDEEIEKVLGGKQERLQYEKAITKAQDESTKKAVDVCPEYTNTLDFMSKIAGEG